MCYLLAKKHTKRYKSILNLNNIPRKIKIAMKL